MKKKIVRYLAILASGFLVLTSCEKGEPIPETNFITFRIMKLFTDSPPMDIYINGAWASALETGEVSANVLLRENSGQTLIELKKRGESEVLIDTVLDAIEGGQGLTYLYNEALGFNQFAGSDFKRPSADSIAFQCVNNFNYGSGLINVYVYTSEDGYSYSAENKIDSLMEIPKGKASAEVKSFPYVDENGQQIMYVLVVKDAVTGYDGTAEYLIDIGLDPGLGGWPISTSGTSLTSGLLTILNVENFPYEENGKHYEQVSMSKLFEY